MNLVNCVVMYQWLVLLQMTGNNVHVLFVELSSYMAQFSKFSRLIICFSGCLENVWFPRPR